MSLLRETAKPLTESEMEGTASLILPPPSLPSHETASIIDVTSMPSFLPRYLLCSDVFVGSTDVDAGRRSFPSDALNTLARPVLSTQDPRLTHAFPQRKTNMESEELENLKRYMSCRQF